MPSIAEIRRFCRNINSAGNHPSGNSSDTLTRATFPAREGKNKHAINAMTEIKYVIARECNDRGNPRNNGRSGCIRRAYSNLRVCSPVEAGEVARVARRRGGDLPRGLRQRLRMTVNKQIVILSKPAKDRPRRQNVIAGKNKQLFLFRVGAVFMRGYAEFDFELLYKIRKRVVTRGGTDLESGFIRSD